MVAHEAPARNPEKQTRKPEIPKSREIFTGDINDAVIAVQQITGFEITTDWWLTEVGNDGATEDILDRFDYAFEKFVHAQMGIESDEENDFNENQSVQSEVVAEADSEVAGFDDAVTTEPALEPLREEFLDALRAHLEEKYFQVSEEFESMEGEMPEFNLTIPESRLYTADEDYRFLVHVPLGNIERRADEIGSPREGVLMTSLITNHSQGTFQGYGGLIMRQPEAGKIRGMSKIDVGSEIPNGQMDTVESLTEPSDPTDYNQIDVLFDGTEVEAVLIKLTPDGNELGRDTMNKELREFAKKNDLPVVEIEVQPMEPLKHTEVRNEVLPNNAGDMLYVTVPFEGGVVQCRVLRAGDGHSVYHELDGNRFAGSSKINQYGEFENIFTEDEERALVDTLLDLKTADSRIAEEDIQALQKEIKRLRRERENRS